MRVRRATPQVEVAPGERLLASASSESGVAAGTREALYLPVAGMAVRIPWEQIESVDWDGDSEVLRVVEVGEWGEPRPDHRLVLTSPGHFLELVRERVTASVVLQRHVAISGKRGVKVIARRPPGPPAASLVWLFEYDEGIDPDDPLVALAAEEALHAAREEVGEA